jgi:hypothetical protein
MDRSPLLFSILTDLSPFVNYLAEIEMDQGPFLWYDGFVNIG